MQKFPLEVCEKLGYYVYRLIDPRNGETFYIGKGKNNRVFDHVNELLNNTELDDELSYKLGRIREIKLSGLDVLHIIHRHGMSEDVALEVEAALIDAYAGLSNQQNGQSSNDFGSAHAQEILRRYQTEVLTLNHKVLFICVNKTILEENLYDAVRYAWRIDPQRASEADFVLAVSQGIVQGVFLVEKWLEASIENVHFFNGKTPVKGRWGFVGCEATKDIQEQYIAKRVPDEFSKRGASNPIKYSWK